MGAFRNENNTRPTFMLKTSAEWNPPSTIQVQEVRNPSFNTNFFNLGRFSSRLEHVEGQGVRHELKNGQEERHEELCQSLFQDSKHLWHIQSNAMEVERRQQTLSLLIKEGLRDDNHSLKAKEINRKQVE